MKIKMMNSKNVETKKFSLFKEYVRNYVKIGHGVKNNITEIVIWLTSE